MVSCFDEQPRADGATAAPHVVLALVASVATVPAAFADLLSWHQFMPRRDADIRANAVSVTRQGNISRINYNRV